MYKLPPPPLLRSIYRTVEAARYFVRERRKDSPLHCRLREASETLNEMLKLEEKEEHPFWYTLYEGMIGRYVSLRVEFRHMKEENKQLRTQNRELKEKYLDAMKRIEPISSVAEKW